MNQEMYTISRSTLKKVTEVLRANWFGSNEDGEYNKYEVMEASELLEAEIEGQEDNN